MRHRVYGNKLGRDKNERTALFKSLVHSLLIYGTIQTSETKAKAIKGLVDKIINLAKNKNSQRLVATYLTQKPLQDRLIKEIAPKLTDRVSGYTSIIKIGKRGGDNARIVRMSIIGSEQLEPIVNIKDNPQKLETSKKAEETKKTIKTVKTVKKVAKKK